MQKNNGRQRVLPCNLLYLKLLAIHVDEIHPGHGIGLPVQLALFLSL